MVPLCTSLDTEVTNMNDILPGKIELRRRLCLVLMYMRTKQWRQAEKWARLAGPLGIVLFNQEKLKNQSS